MQQSSSQARALRQPKPVTVIPAHQPVIARAPATITDVTDSSTGTSGSEVGNIPVPADLAGLIANGLPAMRNNFATLAAKINEILAYLRSAG
jgi:hypothetical protein